MNRVSNRWLLCLRRILTHRLGRQSLLGAVSALLLLSWVSQGGVVFAHANLMRAEPAPNSTVAETPDRISLWFTEPIEPGFSEIQVLNAQGERVDNGDSVVEARDRTAISVMLPTLPNGTYAVVWKNLSAVDGHILHGSFIFAIGEPIAEVSPVPLQKPPLVQSPIEPILRWLGLLGILSVVGCLNFELMVTSPVLAERHANQAIRGVGRRLTYRTLKLMWLGVGLFMVALVGQLLVQTTVVYDIPLYKTLGSPPISILKSTDWGHLWLWRLGLLLVMAAVLGALLARLFQPLEKSQSPRIFLQTTALAVGGGVLFTLSLVSHGAATGEIQTAAVFSDYLHLLAASFWVGGLFHFALGVPLIMKTLATPERQAVLSGMALRFSALAIISVGTLIITGLYGAWAQVTAVSAIATPYGLTLLVKIGLVTLVLFLGALNLLWVKPRLTKEAKAGQWLRRFVTGEAILAVLVLFSVGLLSSLEPARQVASRQTPAQQSIQFFHDWVEDVHIFLITKAGQTGQNKVEVFLDDLRDGKPISNASVSLQFNYLAAELGESHKTAVVAGEGRYVVENAFLSIEGPWQVNVVVTRPDAFDARTAFRFDLTLGSSISSAVITPSPRTSKLLWGVELLLLGLLFLGVGTYIESKGWMKRAGTGVMGLTAVAAILAGLFIIFNTLLTVPQTPRDSSNPFPPTPQSLSVGQQLYEEDCQVCHGATGRADGPLAAGLQPPPLDLTVHVPLHSDRELFLFIREGIGGTAMPPQNSKLTDDEIWHIINYIKTFGK